MGRRRRTYQPRKVETLTHDEAGRPNIPTAEYQALLKDDEQHPIQVAFERRNPDLDPQLVWRGKDPRDWSDLITTAPPLYIQEKVHPKALIDDLRSGARASRRDTKLRSNWTVFGLQRVAGRRGADRLLRAQANWSNRMILGDSLHVMASLAEREGCAARCSASTSTRPTASSSTPTFSGPPPAATSATATREHITREPEQVKAFRDTWRDGIHSYLTYLRDRLTVARDLLARAAQSSFRLGMRTFTESGLG